MTLPSVELEIRDITLHIAEDHPMTAMQFGEKLRRAILSLERLPARFPLMRRTKKFGFAVRILSLGNYQVFFTIRESDVLVLHVRHAARRPPSKFEI